MGNLPPTTPSVAIPCYPLLSVAQQHPAPLFRPLDLGPQARSICEASAKQIETSNFQTVPNKASLLFELRSAVLKTLRVFHGNGGPQGASLSFQPLLRPFPALLDDGSSSEIDHDSVQSYPRHSSVGVFTHFFKVLPSFEDCLSFGCNHCRLASRHRQGTLDREPFLRKDCVNATMEELCDSWCFVVPLTCCVLAVSGAPQILGFCFQSS